MIEIILFLGGVLLGFLLGNPIGWIQGYRFKEREKRKDSTEHEQR